MVKLSKRTGETITLRELMDEVGTDAARYFFCMRSLDSQLDFDMTLATENLTKILFIISNMLMPVFAALVAK